MQPYPGGVHGGNHVACSMYYVYRKVSASLASSVALQLPLIAYNNISLRLMTLGVSKLSP